MVPYGMVPLTPCVIFLLTREESYSISMPAPGNSVELWLILRILRLNPFWKANMRPIFLLVVVSKAEHVQQKGNCHYQSPLTVPYK